MAGPERACAPREKPAAAGRPERARGEVSEGTGSAREARDGGGPARRPRGVSSTRLCQAAADWAPPPCAPTLGSAPPQTPAHGTADVGPVRPPAVPAARPLFCSSTPGFGPSLGRRCGRKLTSRTLLESLNGKVAHLPCPGTARLIFKI